VHGTTLCEKHDESDAPLVYFAAGCSPGAEQKIALNVIEFEYAALRTALSLFECHFRLPFRTCTKPEAGMAP
jgi:hypothetical protein